MDILLGLKSICGAFGIRADFICLKKFIYCSAPMLKLSRSNRSRGLAFQMNEHRKKYQKAHNMQTAIHALLVQCHEARQSAISKGQQRPIKLLRLHQQVGRMGGSPDTKIRRRSHQSVAYVQCPKQKKDTITCPGQNDQC